MGLLPQLADGVGVSIPTAGHVISAYAIGVVVGAPLIAVFGARLPRRELLIGLMLVFLVGNAASALATSYTSLTLVALLRRTPARRLLRGRVAGGRRPRQRRPARPGGQPGDARPRRLQRRGRPGRHLARPERRLALGVLAGDGARRRSPPSSCSGWSRTSPPTARRRVATSCVRSRTRRCCSRCSPARSASAACSRCTPTSPRPSPTSPGSPSRLVPLYVLAFGRRHGRRYAARPAGSPTGRCFRTMLVGSVLMGLTLVAFTVTSQWFLPGLLTVFVLSTSARCSWSACRCG